MVSELFFCFVLIKFSLYAIIRKIMIKSQVTVAEGKYFLSIKLAILVSQGVNLIPKNI